MDRLLIAVQSDIYASFLSNALKGEYEIMVCCDGCEALRLLNTFRPDAAIISLRLSRADCITILEQSGYIPGIVLGIADHFDPYCFAAAQRLGMKRILIMPTVNALCVALCQMRLMNQQEAPPSPESQTQLMLHCLGLLPHLDGFKMLCIGIPMCAADPTKRLSKEIYPAIAQQLGHCDSRSVEAAIRRAIEKAWLHCSYGAWSKYFPADKDGQIPCPTNSRFIKRLAQQLRF